MAHGNLPSASSSSYARNNYYVYDVFLNHRGPDCKETFATDLYNCLRGYGLGVFLDKRELKQGDRLDSQIEGAILKASVHVAIFSQTYAQSSWCLDELVLMLRSGATIVPVFYGGVKPSDLRWVEGNPAGPYARDLQELEQKTTVDIETSQNKPRYHEDTVKEWRRALSQAADIIGFELKKNDSEQHPIIRQIAEAVLKNVKKPVYVAEHPVGLDRKVEDFQRVMSLQQPSSETRETRVIGIVGLGGVGKTTLAREIFNRFLSTYDRYCFLSDISGKSLVSSQIVLLRDLARCSEEIRDIDDGKQKIIRYLSPPSSDGTEKKIFPPALIIVDNVDLIEQLNALQLVTVKANIGEGSLMLITSRNRDVLKSSGLVAESSIYELRGLDARHSQELFCWHAFHQPNPVAVFEPVVEKFLELCKGLPLTLQVIGASLAGQDELRYWEAAWGKIISERLPRDIIDRLKISYDGLDDEEKQIFLDVACFFIGEDCDTAITICDASGWNGWLGFRKLQNRCLMEVDSKNRITMPNHVRDLGREIGEKEPPHRLWRPTDNLQYDLSMKEFPVRGIDMALRDGYKWPHPQLFESLAKLQNSRFLFNMSELQLLRAEGNYVESILSVLQSPQQVCPPPQLVWLSCCSCPFTSLPSSLPLNKLRVLELEDFSKSETPWQDDYQAPSQLRELLIHTVHGLSKIPKSIWQLKHLERMDVTSWSDSIVEIPKEFCDLRSLKHLVLHVTNLSSLPDSFENLSTLEHINLSACGHLERLRDSFGNLSMLQRIDLSGCGHLERLPDSFGNLSKLERIYLSDCGHLQRLPDSFGNLSRLKHIDMSYCRNLERLPDSFGSLSRLQHINLSHCDHLQRLPDSFGNLSMLEHINLSACGHLERLPDSFGNLSILQRIDLSGCGHLERLPDSFWNLLTLEHINLSACGYWELPDSFGNLWMLEHIDLSGCGHLERLPDSFGTLSMLEHIDLSGCGHLQRLPDSFGNLLMLERIYLSDCGHLQRLPDSFGNLSRLKHIDMSYCRKLERLPDSFGSLWRLEHINLSHCDHLQRLPDSFGNLLMLERIYLSDCGHLQRLPDSFGNLSRLKHIDMSYCRKLERLPDSFGSLSILRHINLSHCDHLQRLPDSFGNLWELQHINLSHCGIPYCFRTLRLTAM